MASLAVDSEGLMLYGSLIQAIGEVFEVLADARFFHMKAFWITLEGSVGMCASCFHFRIEPVSPAYIFGIQIVPVTVVTKYANAIPISLFVC
jgi:hypothetical protein